MSQIQPAEMAEKGAGPAVIKSSKWPKSEAKYENDSEYENVEKKKEPAQYKTDNAEYAEIPELNGVYQTLDTTELQSDKAAGRNCSYQLLVCCFGTLCVILMMIIIGVCVYFATVRESAASELNQLKSNQRVLMEENRNLTNLINKLSSDYENVTFFNEKLREDSKNLTELIKNMEETWNELNVSRAQWSIDQYCPKNNGGRSCTSCQYGWNYKLCSCYAYKDYEPPDQRTWEEAQEDCRRKNSDLTVVSNQIEKDYVNLISHGSSGVINGYWIGLRAVGGKWKWIDGSDLTDQTWTQPATDGYYVTSLNGQGWNAALCSDKNAWICEKKALSV